MSSESLTPDDLITRLIADIMIEDPSAEAVRTTVDRLKRRLGSRLLLDHTQAQPSLGLRRRGSAWPARWRYSLRLGIAAAVVGSFALWQWVPARRAGAGVAFGQILDTVRRATSMTYTAIEHPPEGGGESIQFQIRGSRWVRAVSARTGIRIIDLQDSRLLRFDHPQQPATSATLFTFVGKAAQALQGAAGPLAELADILPGDGEPLGDKLIDGQAVTGFRVRRATLVDGRGDHSVWDIWADSQTARVVRVDIHHELGEGEGGVTLVDFDFDVDLEDSLFDLQPPPGYAIAHETIEEIDPADR